MASAHLAMGAWHAELVALVGSFLARITYGAREKDAIAHFEKALKRDPDGKAVYLEYALGCWPWTKTITATRRAGSSLVPSRYLRRTPMSGFFTGGR